jgi:RHS repeat-associated protein
MAKAIPFRFSSKYQDDETDLLYYGYRYYNASTGRWLSKDPKQEKGGLNLYGFVRNSPVNNWDFLGKCILVKGGNPNFGGAIQLTSVNGSDHAEVSVSANDGDFCQMGCLDLIFTFVTDYYDTTQSNIEDDAKFFCDGQPAHIFDFGPAYYNAPDGGNPGKGWKVMCSKSISKCKSQSGSITLGMAEKKDLSVTPTWNYSSLVVNWDFQCDCACRDKGCLNLNTSKGNATR